MLVPALDQVFSWLGSALEGPRAATATGWQGPSEHNDNNQTTANLLGSYLDLAAQLGITSYLEAKVDFRLMAKGFLNFSVFLRHLFTSLILGTRSEVWRQVVSQGPVEEGQKEGMVQITVMTRRLYRKQTSRSV